MVKNGLNTSIIGRAIDSGIIELEVINIRDYTLDKHKKVDDYPYGGGAGMVMQAQPIYDSYMSIVDRVGHKIPCIYLTPQGKTFNQDMASEYSKLSEAVLLCGHYEGVDERVLEEIVTDYVSIGDFVVTGGELPAMIMVDAIARLVPGVLHNDDSAASESFSNNLLEYPQYTRPEVWNDKKVPEILLSGNHAKLDEWRYEMSVERTKKYRPDLLDK